MGMKVTMRKRQGNSTGNGATVGTDTHTPALVLPSDSTRDSAPEALAALG